MPGAVLLDEALHEIERSRGLELTRWRIMSVKFLSVVRPGDVLTLHHCAPNPATVRFEIRNAGRPAAAGLMAQRADGGDGAHGA